MIFYILLFLGLVVILGGVLVSGQYELGHSSLRSEDEATTCDQDGNNHYNDNGRACAWHTFMCENLTSAMDLIPTCFEGAAQSPIDLNSNVATVADPGAVVFQGFDFDLSLANAVLRIQNFALQLDFEPLTTTPTTCATGLWEKRLQQGLTMNCFTTRSRKLCESQIFRL